MLSPGKESNFNQVLRCSQHVLQGPFAKNADAGSVGAKLQLFYESHDYGEDGGAHKRIAFLHLGSLRIPFPNGKQRRELLYIHDIDHLVTGYDTSWCGEACLAAWEMRTRSWDGKFTLWLLVASAIAWGLIICPCGVLAGWRLGGQTRSVLSLGLTREELLALPLHELKNRLGLSNRRSESSTIEHSLIRG